MIHTFDLRQTLPKKNEYIFVQKFSYDDLSIRPIRLQYMPLYSQTFICTVYKNPDTLRYAILHWTFEIGGGAGTFLYEKKALYVRFLYAKNNAIGITVLYTKYWHFYLNFNMQSSMQPVLHFYF